MRARLVALAVLVTAMALLTTIDRPLSRSGGAPPATAIGPVVPSGAARHSIWYCAAGGAGTAGATHDVVIANPYGASVRATVTDVVGRGDAPAEGTTTTTTPPPSTRTLQVGGRSTAVVPSTPGASVQVELDRVGAVVTHRIVADAGFDEAACATAGSPTAYFPATNTNTSGGASAQLWLFNPFPTDASVNVQVASEDGVRQPGPLDGIVVPGGTSRVVEIGRVVQVRDQFAMSVTTRSGSVIAELSQVEPGDGGLVLTPGIAEVATRLAFADGQSGTGIAERYVVYNPGRREAAVLVSVVPYDADASILPEPFDLTVPAHRFVVLDLDQQARVPADRPHWVRLESVNGEGVAVERLTRIAGAPNPWSLQSGSASSTGQAVASEHWAMPWADRSPEATSTLLLANPSTDTRVRVRLRRLVGGKEVAVGDGGETEIGAGRGVAIDLGAAGAEPGVLLISSSAPIVAERRVAAASHGDLSVIAPVGRAGDLDRLPSMSHAAEAELGGK